MKLLHRLAFYASYPGWQSFAGDKATVKLIKSLENKRFLKVIWKNRQAQFTNWAVLVD